MSLFRQLAKDIQGHVDVIDDSLARLNASQPTFTADSPTGLPLDAQVQQARLLLIEKAWAIANLAIGSADHLRWHMMNAKFDDMALHFLAEYNVFDAVPRNGKISYSELSRKVDLGEHRLRRVLAMAYTNHYFYEPEPGFVAHTSNSAIAIGDPLARGWILHNVDEVQPWYTNKLPAATRKWGDTTDPYHVGPNLEAKPGEEKTFYQFFEEDDQGEWNGVKGKGFRLWRLYDTDTFFQTGGAIKGTNLLRAFDWKGLGRATVVDIAGITGFLASQVALANPDLSFIIQMRSQPWYEKKFYEQLPVALHSRFRYMPHDNYSEQPIKGAEVYFLATVLHKEPDEKAITIIRRTVAAMDPKRSRILTRDIVMDGGDPPAGDTVLNGKTIDNKSVYQAGLGPTGAITRLNIGIDFQVLSVMNAFERNRAEWIDLFERADPRLKLKQCVQTVGDCASVMEWVLE
ncbi:putative 6-hydroxytryprostatin B O-methyltransferase [Microsporum canis]|uniref:O-methyltransferase n=1 Tax=Arthroderma otae (strain ATCC MYA-4605 / CBS 113480) TaxID=554155 RepID=C5G0H6_ARTOC|nr:O-methyltransferase [Microsporum canis CBS 113480]EEQ35629.1 O-methyltransferase [Microsporum canis CBS 113480]